MKQPIIKQWFRCFVSLAVSVCMLLPPAYGVSLGGSIGLSGRAETPIHLQIEVPENLASLEEVYEAPPSQKPKLVLHIQSIHGNYETQIKIKKILDYLHETYGFKLIFVEGASKKLDAGKLKIFPDEKSNQAFIGDLAQKGELSGSELFYLEHSGSVEAIGIESSEKYLQNYQTYREIKSADKIIDRFLDVLRQRLLTLSSRTFSSDQRRVLSEWEKFSSGQREFLPYVKQLSKDAKKFLDLDLESLFAQVEWPQLTRLLVIQSMEKELNLEKAKEETGRLVEFLKTHRVDAEMVKSVQELGNRKITMSRVTSRDPRIEYLPRYLLERLADTAGPLGFKFQDYPAFSVYAGHLILQSEIQSAALFDEIEKLFAAILDSMALTEAEKDLLELYRDEKNLSDLFHLELSRKKWERAVYRRDWISPRAMLRRLGSLLSKAEGAAEPNETFREFRSKDIQNFFMTAFRFYDFARERENFFYETVIREMDSRDSEKAVLITGGFHTEGISEMFRDGGINYGILTPKVSGKTDTGNYASIMSGKQKTLFDLATLEIGLLLGDLANAGFDDARAKSVMDSVIKITKDLPYEARREVFRRVSDLGKGELFRGSVVEDSRNKDQYHLLFFQQERSPAGYTLHFTNAGGVELNRMTGDQVFDRMKENGLQVGDTLIESGQLPAVGISAASVLPTALSGTRTEIKQNELRVNVLAKRLGEKLLARKAETPAGQTPVLDRLEIPAAQRGVTFHQILQSRGPQSSVFSLTWGLVAPNGGPEEVSRAIGENGFGDSRRQSANNNLITDSRLAASNAPGALVRVTNQIPQRNELRELGVFLQANANQHVTLVVAARKGFDSAKMEKAISVADEISRLLDSKNRPIGGRLNIQFIPLPDVSLGTMARQLARTIRKIGNDLNRKLRMIDKTALIGDYLVIDLDEEVLDVVDRDLLSGVFILSRVKPEHATQRNFVGIKLSQANGDLTTLLLEVGDNVLLPGNSPGEYRLTDESLASLLNLAAAVQQMVQASA